MAAGKCRTGTKSNTGDVRVSVTSDTLLRLLHKLLFLGKGCIVYHFEDERILQSQKFLLNMLKLIWNGNQRYIRKIRSTFRHSDIWRRITSADRKTPSDLFGRLVFAALKEGIGLVHPLPLSPLASNSASHHYNEAAAKCLIILPLPKPCSFTVYLQGD